jgi:hypothetical protein
MHGLMSKKKKSRKSLATATNDSWVFNLVAWSVILTPAVAASLFDTGRAKLIAGRVKDTLVPRIYMRNIFKGCSLLNGNCELLLGFT